MVASPKAFDDRRAPDPKLIEDCVHCGFCLPTCPTYVLWGEEMDSPRGRIVLMRTGNEAGSEMSDSMATHFDRCLGCMACVTACPSGVQYDRLIEQTRPQVERNYERSRADRALRRAIFGLFTHPGRLRATVPFVAAGQRLGLDRGLARLASRRWPHLASLPALAPSIRTREAFRRLPAFTRAHGSPRGRVAVLQGCVQRVFFQGVNAATVRVLAAEGYDVVAPARPACCGALMMHSGYEEEAKERAKEAIRAFEAADQVVTNAAGCGSAMKDYRHLFEGDAEWAERALKLSEKVRDVTELLGGVEPRVERSRVDLRVAYHDACHLAHAQGIRAQPRALLEGIPGIEVVEPVEWEICCGSAGIYNMLQPDAANELGRRKAVNLLNTNAAAIAAGNPGCTLQITSHLHAMGHDMPVYHPVELLDASINGTPLIPNELPKGV